MLLLGLMFGLALLGKPLHSLGTTLDLPTVGERAEVLEAHGTSARFEDRAGKTRACHGYDFEVGEILLYDATRCRPERFIGVPQPVEWVLLVCGGFFCLIGILGALESEPDSSQGSELPPPEVRHTVLPDGHRLVLPWRHTVGPAGVVLQLMLITGAGAAAWFFPVALLVVLGLLYSLVYTLVNATTIEISAGRVDIRHGPLPSFTKGMCVDLERLDDLRVKEHHSGRATYHALVGGSRQLLHHWSRPAPLAYVKRCIEHAREPR